MRLASRWLLWTLLLSGCRSTLPNRDPLGQALPSVTGEALDGREWRLPEDLAGRPAVLLVGYEQRAQFDADRWLFGLLQAETPARLLEVPTIPGLFGRALAGTIDSGMRSGIPHEDWGTVVTLYGDAAARMKAFTGTENGRNMRVLVVDEHGVVRWSHDRGFSAAKCLELDRLVRSLGPGELAAPTTSPSPTSAVPPSAERTPPALDPTTTWTQWRGPTRDGQAGGLIRSAVLEVDDPRARRRAEREAIWCTLEELGLVTRTRGTRPAKCSKAARLS